MNLVIDIGNTRTKAAVFSNNDCIDECTTTSNKVLSDFIGKYTNSLNKGIISAVGKTPEFIDNRNKNSSFPVITLNENTPLPFVNSYNTKDTLGKDRIAAIAGAMQLYPNRNILVIDTGTAITYDIITSEKKYLGGNIAPGITMRYKALNAFTARLPLLKNVKETSLIGTSTSAAIENGVQNGIVYEINGFIDDVYTRFPNLIILITGGDSQYFENKLKKPIFVLSNLTLRGLNYILEYNA